MSTKRSKPAKATDRYIAYSEIGEKDHLLGRGLGNHGRGNKIFKELVIANVPLYRNASKSNKPNVSVSVVNAWKRQGGRFLQRKERNAPFSFPDELWFEVGEREGCHAASMLLRRLAREESSFEDRGKAQATITALKKENAELKAKNAAQAEKIRLLESDRAFPTVASDGFHLTETASTPPSDFKWPHNAGQSTNLIKNSMPGSTLFAALPEAKPRQQRGLLAHPGQLPRNAAFAKCDTQMSPIKVKQEEVSPQEVVPFSGLTKASPRVRTVSHGKENQRIGDEEKPHHATAFSRWTTKLQITPLASKTKKNTKTSYATPKAVPPKSTATSETLKDKKKTSN